MLIKNMHYVNEPPSFEVRISGKNACVLFPRNVKTTENEDGEVSYIAENVYYVETGATANLEERVRRNQNAWLAKAMVPDPIETTLSDVVEAINVLAEILLGEGDEEE